ncbi:MAG TPA: hypothetical protein VG389_23910 [Myxococcota bacterium]|jgi:hypothetical protein|nr:hypothetical protein [Myxococcota bacterium]
MKTIAALPLFGAAAAAAAALLAAPSPAYACHGHCPYAGGGDRAIAAEEAPRPRCTMDFSLPPPALGLFAFEPYFGFTRMPGEGEHVTMALGLAASSPALFVPGTKLGGALRVSGDALTNGEQLQAVADVRAGWLGWGSAALLVGGGAAYGDVHHGCPPGKLCVAADSVTRSASAVVRTGLELGLAGKLFLDVPIDVHVVPGDPSATFWTARVLLSARIPL